MGGIDPGQSLGGVDPTQLMGNLGLMAVIFQDISIIMGLGLFMFGLFRLKRYAEARTMMSHQMTIAGPLMLLIGGTMFLCFPLVLRTALFNFWSTTHPNPMAYAGGDSYEQLIPPIVIFVRLIGVGSFMRGVLLFSRVGGEQSQPGTLSKACIHMFAGILCIHILGTVDLLRSIFGMSAF